MMRATHPTATRRRKATMAAPAQQQLGVLVDDRSEDVDQTPAAHEAHCRTVSAVALTKTEAARALGMSVRSLDKYVMSEIKVIGAAASS